MSNIAENETQSKWQDGFRTYPKILWLDAAALLDLDPIDLGIISHLRVFQFHNCLEPVERRMSDMAASLNITERTLRRHAQVLQQRGLLEYEHVRASDFQYITTRWELILFWNALRKAAKVDLYDMFPDGDIS